MCLFYFKIITKEVFVSRDADVCLLKREQEAVNEWLGSNKLFHIMRFLYFNFFKYFIYYYKDLFFNL